MNRLRWWIANAWDWIFPRSCWPETYLWSRGDGEGRLRVSDPCTAGCKSDGYCWCGKKCVKGGRP